MIHTNIKFVFIIIIINNIQSINSSSINKYFINIYILKHPIDYNINNI